MCEESRWIGCVIPGCKLQRGNTQPILGLFLTYPSTFSFSVEDCIDQIEVYNNAERALPFETCLGLDSSYAYACTPTGVPWAYGTYNIEYENGAEKLVNGYVTYTMDYSYQDEGGTLFNRTILN